MRFSRLVTSMVVVMLWKMADAMSTILRHLGSTPLQLGCTCITMQVGCRPVWLVSIQQGGPGCNEYQSS
ncbi:hypothetical protein KC335_g35 [Hortaea werneckii]|nr:hypothetical protein KC335_g35 [Hortaea werneckii]